MQQKGFWLAAAGGVGILQVLDSGALSAGLVPALLAFAGVVLPVATTVMRFGAGVRIGALVLGAVLLVAARVVSATSLNGLHIALVPIALYILVVDRRLPQPGTTTPA